GGHRDQGQVELGVGPLDLDDARNVGVDVEATVRTGALLRTGCCGTRRVQADVRVLVRRLAPRRVDLETEHELRGADFGRDVRPHARAGIPLDVLRTRGVDVRHGHVLVP